MIRLLPALALALCSIVTLKAQAPTFQFLDAAQFTDASEVLYSVSVDVGKLTSELRDAPPEFQQLKTNATVNLPLPDGSFAEFLVYNSPLMPNHPELGSYKLHGPWGGGRMSISADGVTAMAKGPSGYFMLMPDRNLPGQHQVSKVRDYLALAIAEDVGDLSCGNTSATIRDLDFPEEVVLAKSANTPQSLHVYDMVMTCTGEFSRNFGGSTAAVQANFNRIMNLINTVYENDLGIRINLLDEPGLIYLDPSTDPYEDSANGFALLSQIQAALDSNGIAATSFDLAHILYTGCSGLLGVAPGSVCNDGNNQNKILGASCIRRDRFEGDVLATMSHEIGHQFDGSHTWSRCGGDNGDGWAFYAIEPGGGSTTMAYGEICGNQSFTVSEPYFHSISVEQISDYARRAGGAPCAEIIETDNFTPTVSLDYEDGFVIPIGTPFRLEGQATDVNDDALTYTWEQFDRDLSYSPLGQPVGNAPIFRSVFPSTDGWQRYFPRLDLIVRDIDVRSERIPTYSRDLTFRLTAFDNNPEAGGVDWQEVRFRADSMAGPFIVNNPDTSSWYVGDHTEITWDVANTNQAPVNCQFVNILMSTNGGISFDLVLAENELNDGSAFITVPEEAVFNDVYIMVEAADNVFLDVNTIAIEVQEATRPAFTFESDRRYQNVCLPEVLSLDLNSGSVLGFSAPIELSIEMDGLPEGTVATLSETEIMPGNSSNLQLDLSDVNFTGRTELTVVAVAEGQDTARRVIILDMVSTDYTDLATTSPIEGASGIILSTDFSWVNAINANSYDIQIGTSPTFSEETLFEEATNLPDTDYLPADFFASNTLYFWRVRPNNSCGAGDWLDPNSFRTVNSQCERYTQTEPVTIPGTGPAFMRESTLFIEQQGTINDLNIPNVNVRYNFPSNVTLTLVSPAGTEVILYNETCFGSTNRIDLGFDDDAPIAVACPPDDQRVFIPSGTLADFNGEDTFGAWVLRIDVSETGGSAGAIDGWEIEFCADISASAPERINNIATEVPPMGRNSIEGDKLQVISPVYGSGEVEYTITALPEAGRLTLYGTELAVGDDFLQADINGEGLFYENTDEAATTDDFGFVVTTPDGGYLAIDYHDIIINENAVVSNGNVSVLEDNLKVFPNPTAGDINLRWTASTSRDLNLELYDLNGRLLNRQIVNGRTGTASLSTSELPSGIYLLRIDGVIRRVVKR